MKQKIFAIFVMALAVFMIAACSPTTTEVEPETDTVVDTGQQVTVAPTAVEVAEEPATPTAAPTNTAETVPTDEPTEAPAASSDEAAEAGDEETADENSEEPDEPDDAMAAESAPVQFGRTEEGAFFYGSPSAGITLIDHSDFL